MARIRTVLVDDEPLARERIRTLLAAHDDVEIVAECTSGIEALRAITELQPHLVFLDVQMPELDGFGVVDAIEQPVPAIVFVTAYDQYAIRAFEVHALDYLLKPFDRDRFEKALSRARKELQRGESGALQGGLEDLLRELRTDAKRIERLVVRSGGRIFFIRTDEVDWIEAEGNYVRLHTGSESHLVRETMTNLEARLDPGKFLRVQRSALVNIESVRELRPWFQGDYLIVMRDGRELTSGRGYRETIRRFINRHGI